MSEMSEKPTRRVVQLATDFLFTVKNVNDPKSNYPMFRIGRRRPFECDAGEFRAPSDPRRERDNYEVVLPP
jgi:hypothetical protein